MSVPPARRSLTKRVHAGWYELVYWTCLVGLKLGFSLRTEGRANVPLQGPALLIANHQSFLDPALVGVAARRQLRYLARQTLFRHRAFAWLIRSLNAVPIDQEGIGIHGLRVILQQLQAGEAVLVFPEGERTMDGQLHALQPGVQLLIKRARAPVVPVGIAGAFAAWPRWRSYPVPSPLVWPATERTIAVSVGTPLDPARLAELPREGLLGELDEALRSCIRRAEAMRRQPDRR